MLSNSQQGLHYLRPTLVISHAESYLAQTCRTYEIFVSLLEYNTKYQFFYQNLLPSTFLMDLGSFPSHFNSLDSEHEGVIESVEFNW